MMQSLARLTMVGVIALMLLAFGSPVAAHTGEGVSLEHVIIEVGTWALAIVGVIAVIVGVFWVRARASRR